jgi:hypothetical protein
MYYHQYAKGGGLFAMVSLKLTGWKAKPANIPDKFEN